MVANICTHYSSIRVSTICSEVLCFSPVPVFVVTGSKYDQHWKIQVNRQKVSTLCSNCTQSEKSAANNTPPWLMKYHSKKVRVFIGPIGNEYSQTMNTQSEPPTEPYMMQVTSHKAMWSQNMVPQTTHSNKPICIFYEPFLKSTNSRVYSLQSTKSRS